jgi:sec-independent protein translocase protein TatB
MFGVDFSELALIFIVALVVLGPTRLPGLVRKVGRWVGKARGMARDFQQQLENEINIDELNRATKKTVDEALGMTPVPPAEFTGDPPRAEATESIQKTIAESGYPYGPTSEPEAPSTPDPATPQPGDDTYSHAHAHGDAPMRDEPAATEAGPSAGADGNPDFKKDSAAA